MEKVKKVNNSYILEMFKALVIALIISLLLVLAVSFAIKLFNIPENISDILLQVIKGLSILIAALFSFKLPKNGWIRGLVFGIFYIALAFLVFSLLDGEFKFGLPFLNDMALGSVSGLISGIIAVNLRKRA